MQKIITIAVFIRITLIAAIVSISIIANAQSVAVNTNGAAADNSAMLDISSNSKGVLITRVTTTQRIGITTPAEGLLVYDTDTKGFWYFSLGAWKEIPKVSAGGFTLPYNGTTNNNTGVFSITNTNAVIGASGLYGKSGVNSSGITPLYSSGVWGENSNGIGVSGTSKTIGVFGATGINDASGVGVMGVSHTKSATNGAVTAINYSSGIGMYAESLDSGIAIYGKTTKQNGAAIYGMNNSVQGRAIQGSATGTDGVAIYGEGGNSNSSSYAGFFRNSNAANTKDVVQIYNQGAGRGLMVDQINASNTDDVIEARNYGTGNFLKLVTGSGDVKTVITKNGEISTDGNIFTQGAIVVRGNKGIVRNSNGNQLRLEELTINIPAYTYSHYDSDWGPGGQTITVTFNTPFFSPPAVYLANCTSGHLLTGLTVDFYDVTTTGCKMFIANWGPYDFPRNACIYKAIAVGTE